MPLDHGFKRVLIVDWYEYALTEQNSKEGESSYIPTLEDMQDTIYESAVIKDAPTQDLVMFHF